MKRLTQKAAGMSRQATDPFGEKKEEAALGCELYPDKKVFMLTGTWSVHTVHAVEKKLRLEASKLPGTAVFDCSMLRGMDTAGALLINTTIAFIQKKGWTASLIHASKGQAELLQLAKPSQDDLTASVQQPSLLYGLSFLGKNICDSYDSAVRLTSFFGHSIVRLLGVLRSPRRMRWTSFFFHMEQTGLRAVPIVSLLTFLIGMVVAYMGAEELANFGAQVFSVKLLEVTIMREMGVLITAIVVAGRSSSSFTSQIGSMVANEEVDAVRSMGLEPIDLFVLPRVLALLFSLPLLVFIADIMALLGGSVALGFSMDLSMASFIHQFYEGSKIQNFGVGMAKAPFFAVIIGLVGCFQGFRATSSAESVGFLTTISVVQSIFLVIIVDAIFAIFFTAIGI